MAGGGRGRRCRTRGLGSGRGLGWGLRARFRRFARSCWGSGIAAEGPHSRTSSAGRGRGSGAGTDTRGGCSRPDRWTGRRSGGRYREQLVVQAAPLGKGRVCSGPGLTDVRGDRGYRSQGGYDGENTMPRDQRLGPATSSANRNTTVLTSPQLRISLEIFAVEGDGRLSGSESISDEAGENMDHGVHGRPVA